MITIDKVSIYGLEETIRGMRNPKNSWDRSDSYYTHIENPETHNTAKFEYFVGENDLDLMKRLANGGPVHAKYRRFVTVYLDITAPLYWWKEFDTYRVGVTPNPADIEMNSCSTMHKIHEKEFTMEDFSIEHLYDFELVGIDGCPDGLTPMNLMEQTVDMLNYYRRCYIEDGKTKDDWWQLIQLLPTSYNQKRSIKLNYEVLANMYQWRRNHKLDEWRSFCEWIELLPYSEIITGPSLENIPICHEIMEEAMRRVREEERAGTKYAFNPGVEDGCPHGIGTEEE